MDTVLFVSRLIDLGLIRRWGDARAFVRRARLGAIVGKPHEAQKARLVGGILPIGSARVTLLVRFLWRIGERQSEHEVVDLGQTILAEGVEGLVALVVRLFDYRQRILGRSIDRQAGGAVSTIWR